MAELPLTGTRGQGKVALIDDADLPLLSQHRWYIDPSGYARTHLPAEAGRRRSIHMHMMLTDAKGGHFTDHINGNPLDNRRANLRPCTAAENNRNRGVHRSSKTGVKGVSPFKKGFRATIHQGRKQIYLGLYPTLDLAAAAYNGAAIALFGAFARLNPIPTPVPEVADAAD